MDAVSGVEAQGLSESGEDTGDLFIWEEAGEGEAGVVVDGDVEGFDAGVAAAFGAITGGADTGALKATQLLDVEVEEIAREVALVADDRWFGRFEGGETIETVAAQDAGESGLGNGQQSEDLGVGAALTAKGEDLLFELRAGLARLAVRN